MRRVEPVPWTAICTCGHPELVHHLTASGKRKTCSVWAETKCACRDFEKRESDDDAPAR